MHIRDSKARSHHWVTARKTVSCVRMSLGEYTRDFVERGWRDPDRASGRGQRESRLLTPFYGIQKYTGAHLVFVCRHAHT